MNWCRKCGLIDATPVHALAFNTEARARILTDSELVAIWQRAEQVGYPCGRIVQLLILRRTFSSTMARLGTPIHVREKLLDDASGAISGVAAIYNRHSYRDEIRA